ncbi:MAG: hypothetical protein WBP42_02800 [Candidatus Zixiibacteriota bacterium]
MMGSVMWCCVSLLICGTIGYADTSITQRERIDAYVQDGDSIPAMSSDITIVLDDKRLRIELPYGQIVLYHADSNSWFTLTPRAEIYSKGQPFEVMTTTATESAGDSIGFVEGLSKIRPSLSGIKSITKEINEEKVINGFRCKKFIVEVTDSADTNAAEVWTTNDLRLNYELYTKSFPPTNFSGPQQARLCDEIAKIVGLHVLVVKRSTDFGADIRWISEVVESKEIGVPDGFYEVPDNFELYDPKGAE